MFSFGIRLSIDNKTHSVFVDLVLAIEIAQFSFWTPGGRLMVFKRCSQKGRLLKVRKGDPLVTHPPRQSLVQSSNSDRDAQDQRNCLEYFHLIRVLRALRWF
jgi:hypothetical protein